jgi:tRNA uridine 5-carboxymethylaminomethyl modification enzyme
MAVGAAGPGVDDPRVAQQVSVQAKYAGYLERQRRQVDQASRYEDVLIPEDLDYTRVHGLSSEVREKLVAHRPSTLGQASRIAGVTPAAVSLLLVHLKREGTLRRSA